MKNKIRVANILLTDLVDMINSAKKKADVLEILKYYKDVQFFRWFLYHVYNVELDPFEKDLKVPRFKKNAAHDNTLTSLESHKARLQILLARSNTPLTAKQKILDNLLYSVMEADKRLLTDLLNGKVKLKKVDRKMLNTVYPEDYPLEEGK